MGEWRIQIVLWLPLFPFTQTMQKTSLTSSSRTLWMVIFKRQKEFGCFTLISQSYFQNQFNSKCLFRRVRGCHFSNIWATTKSSVIAMLSAYTCDWFFILCKVLVSWQEKIFNMRPASMFEYFWSLDNSFYHEDVELFTNGTMLKNWIMQKLNPL